MKTLFVSSSIVFVAMLAHSPLKAQPSVNGQASQSSSTKATDAPIYGSQLMTDRERQEYRDRMRAAKTDAERDQIRKTHHDQMKARAQAKGITLPDEPPVARRVGPPPGSSGDGPGPKQSGPNPPGPKSPGPNPGQGQGRP